MSLYFFGRGYVSRGGVKFSKIWKGGGGSDRFIIILGGLGKKGYPGDAMVVVINVVDFNFTHSFGDCRQILFLILQEFKPFN